MQEIRLTPKKSYTIIGGILMLTGIVIAAFLIPNAIEEGEDGVFLLIGVGVVVVLPLLILGCSLSLGSMKAAKRMQSIIDMYGKEKILYHVKNATIATYNNQITNKVVLYFTEAFILNPEVDLIDYQMIDLMYRKSVYSSYNHSTSVSIGLEMKDGEMKEICTGIHDDQITYYMQIILNHNPYILMGYSDDQKQQHRQHVEAYKNGSFTVPRMNLDLFGQSMNNVGSVQPQTYGREDVCSYIRQNYPPDQKILAIKYYRDQTGVSLSEAKDVVDRLFAPTPVLQEPYEWSKAGQNQKAGDKFIMMGVTVLLLCAVILAMIIIVAISGSADLEFVMAFLVGAVPCIILGIVLLCIGKKKKAAH